MEKIESNQLRQNGSGTGDLCLHEATLFATIRNDDDWDATRGFFASETFEQFG
jgi:hypothetical protein